MKRNFLSLLLMIVLLLSITAEAEDRFTISEIYEQYNGQRWQESYQTVRNETVTIDAPFIIPHVESAPVIRVGHYPSLDPALCDAYGTYPRSTRKHVDVWARSDGRDITLAMDQYWECLIIENRSDGISDIRLYCGTNATPVPVLYPATGCISRRGLHHPGRGLH